MGRGTNNDLTQTGSRRPVFKDACLLFPANPFDSKKCEPHFLPEFEEAQSLGWETALVNDQALHDPSQSFQVPARLQNKALLYRGWMLSGAAYGQFEQALQNSGSTLLTSADAYQNAHHLPQWYPAFKERTPLSVFTDDGSSDPLPLIAQLPDGAAIVKDYVKSMKHLWDDACYIPDVRDTEAALKVINRFRELRGDDLHGLVLRNYRPLGTEYRSWWVDGQLKLVSAHPDTPDQTLPELDLGFLVSGVSQLNARAITVDVAQSEGEWLVVEVGDAMVSDRPQGLDPGQFLQALFLEDN